MNGSCLGGMCTEIQRGNRKGKSPIFFHTHFTKQGKTDSIHKPKTIRCYHSFIGQRPWWACQPIGAYGVSRQKEPLVPTEYPPASFQDKTYVQTLHFFLSSKLHVITLKRLWIGLCSFLYTRSKARHCILSHCCHRNACHLFILLLLATFGKEDEWMDCMSLLL